jgi:hypothetical protein
MKPADACQHRPLKIGYKTGRYELVQTGVAALRPAVALPYTTILARRPETGQVIAERHRMIRTPT